MPDPGPARSLLIADDDDDVAAAVTRLFERRGWTTRRARSGTEAIAIARGDTPMDAALIDLVLPGAGGLDVVRAVRSGHPGCRIVAMTGFGEGAMMQAFLEAGADAFIGKPFDMKALMAAVEGPPPKTS